ncbi:hypothetical protein HYALB_00007338 [Hymenoscyphus albidus]|uniref:2EXR domain-containing protein n=1 Tax=Hymenoscyphus albidus TaxID=595503 RepID=A0A9N9Q3J6_9HELO|nr:hypothetical protein HYALB_00007338 [Hymenoscyphus albidus]
MYRNDSGVAVPADGLKDINDLSLSKRDFDFDTSHKKKLDTVTVSTSIINRTSRLNSALDPIDLLESNLTVTPLASALLSKLNSIANPDAIITKSDTVKVLKTFPYFPNLPLELQRIIWHFTLPDPRLIPLVNWRRNPTQSKTRIETPPEDKILNLIPRLGSYIVPSLLYPHACHESRRIAKKHYIGATGRADFSERFFIDWETDVLHGSAELFVQLLGTALGADFDERVRISNLKFLAQVRHIYFSGGVVAKVVLDLLAGYMPLFSRLESITLVQRGDTGGEGEGEGGGRMYLWRDVGRTIGKELEKEKADMRLVLWEDLKVILHGHRNPNILEPVEIKFVPSYTLTRP